MVACRIIVSVPVPFLWTLGLGFGTGLELGNSYKISSFHLQGDSGGPLTAYKKVKGPRGRSEYRAFLIGNYQHNFIIKLSYLRSRQSGRGLRLLQSARDLHPDISLARLDQGARWERQMSLRLNKPIKSFITSLITRLTIGHSETLRSRTDLLGIQFRICFLNFRILTL